MNATLPNAWGDALLAARLLAVDPRGLGGIKLRARAGPVREAWLAMLREVMPASCPMRRVAASPDEASLIGGLDFSATLSAGRPVMRSGLLVAANGGLLVLAMAERTNPGCAGLIASALDRGTVRVEREGFSGELEARFALIALDEGIDDEETVPPALDDRLGLRVSLDAVSHREIDTTAVGGDDVARARADLPSISVNEEMMAALVGLAAACGWNSARGAGFLMRAACAAAALRGAQEVGVEDAATAGRLVLGQERLAAAIAQARAEQPPEMPEPGDDASPDRQEAARGILEDTVLEAAAASLPEGVLNVLAGRPASRRPARGEGSGSTLRGTTRGRPLTPVARPAAGQARMDVLATLRVAAPWQRLRGRGRGESVRIRSSDFRYVRHEQRRGVTAIFAVDASGSAAIARLAEAKGAVQLLLADCYVRRDEVALIAFRKSSADILLEPTRSLVRARRALTALPGGGGTPLAAGILATARLAQTLRKRGRDALAIFLTDGRANVGFNGDGGRERAMSDMRESARCFRAMGLDGIVIDTGARPQQSVAELAGELGAEYVALPRGGAGRISATLSDRMKG